MAIVSWINSSGGSWETASNWSTGIVPGAADDAFISAGGTYTVSSSANETVNSVGIAAGKSLSIGAPIGSPQNVFTIGTALNNAGGIGVGNSGFFGTLVLGTPGINTTINNAGGIVFAFFSGKNNFPGLGTLQLNGDLTFLGGGTLGFTLNSFGSAAITGTATLTNADNQISGGISDPNLTLVNQSGGTIVANIIDTGSNVISNAGTIKPAVFGLPSQIKSPISNSGLLDAENQVNLTISGAVTNNGTFKAFGGVVTVSAAVTNNGMIESNGGSMTISAAVANNGTIRTIGGGSMDIQSITGNGLEIGDNALLHLGSSFGGLITFTGANGTFKGSPGSHNLAGDGFGNMLDYSAATSGVEFDLSTGYGYQNFAPAVGVDHFFNMSVFKGGSGNDVFIGGPGSHTFAGNGGAADTLDYSAAMSAVQFNFVTGRATNQFGGTDQFSGMEIFKGGSGDDVFIGGPGDHTIDGGAGTDTLDYSAATTSVQFNLATQKATNAFNGPPPFNPPGTDTFSNIDLFKGGSGIDTFIGGQGNHTLDGGPGNPNILDYSAATTGVEFNIATGLAYNNFGGPTVTVDHFINIAILKGGSGNDIFLGGPGNNVMDGGAGTDTLDYSATGAPVSINLGTGAAMNGYGGTDHWASIEVFKGGSGHDDFLATGAPGTYSFVSGGSADTFGFSGIFGHGTVTNFTSGPDGIYLDHTQFADFMAVQSHAQQVGSDTVISLDTNDTITLQNTMLANLHAGDFHFL